jgi:ADP-heptose:LPS heptosyltransferase
MTLKNKFKSYILRLIAQRNYKTKLDPKKIKKILIVREGGIGDAISIYPLLREIKKNYPNISIDIYAGLSNNFMYTYVNEVNNVYTKYKKRQFIKSFIDLIKMKMQSYDLLIELTPFRMSRTLACIFIQPKYAIAVTGTKKKYGFNREAISFFHKTYPQHENEHIVKRYLHILEYIDIYNPDDKLEFYLPKATNKKHTLKKQENIFYVGFNTDGSHIDKTLSNSQIINICNTLKLDKIKIILFCAPQKRKAFKELINNNNLTNTNLLPETKTIYEAAQVVRNLDLMITPNTSFVHIASGLKIPVLGLFGNSKLHTVVWAPYKVAYDIVTPTKEGTLSLRDINIYEIKAKLIKLLNIQN